METTKVLTISFCSEIWSAYQNEIQEARGEQRL